MVWLQTLCWYAKHGGKHSKSVRISLGHSLGCRVDHLGLEWQINYTWFEPGTLHAKQFYAQNGQLLIIFFNLNWYFFVQDPGKLKFEMFTNNPENGNDFFSLLFSSEQTRSKFERELFYVIKYRFG